MPATGGITTEDFDAVAAVWGEWTDPAESDLTIEIVEAGVRLRVYHRDQLMFSAVCDPGNGFRAAASTIARMMSGASD